MHLKIHSNLSEWQDGYCCNSSRKENFFLLQDIVLLLEEQLRPLVQAELSVLVDVLHRPQLLFPPNTDARRKCESGGFISK